MSYSLSPILKNHFIMVKKFEISESEKSYFAKSGSIRDLVADNENKKSLYRTGIDFQHQSFDCKPATSKQSKGHFEALNQALTM